jgi:hypothetical protein
MWIPLVVALASALAPGADLDAGYRRMYDLRFEEAHRIFAQSPDDPLAVVSDAAAWLFAEFDRMHVLESEFFTDDSRFLHRSQPAPDPRARSGFEADLAKAERLAAASLARSPNDTRALLASVLAAGLRGDYLALVERRYLASLACLKDARTQALKLLSIDGSLYDAYLAVGVENYILSLKPAPVRWILRLGGAQTDRAEGVAKLTLTAEKGRYLAPYARLLLAVADLRDGDRTGARQILADLAREFPNNRLYTQELERLR